MGIATDSTPLEAPKDTTTCTVFKLYQLVASSEQQATMKQQYEQGGFGYGHAKQALFECILATFSEERKAFDYFMNHPDEVEKTLQLGAQKAKSVAQSVLNRVRQKLGFS